jgi:hypothetical protein
MARIRPKPGLPRPEWETVRSLLIPVVRGGLASVRVELNVNSKLCRASWLCHVCGETGGADTIGSEDSVAEKAKSSLKAHVGLAHPTM